MEFFSSWDNISTNVPWTRPELFSLIRYWNEIKNQHNFDNYDVYLTGAFAEYLYDSNKPQTWDIDLCFVFDSDELNYSEIKTILDDSIKIGFKHELLIDVKFNPRKTWDFFQRLYVNPLVDDSELLNFWYLSNWKTFTKIVNGKTENETIIPEDEYTELQSGLYKIKRLGNRIVDKVTQKIDSGLYTNKQINLKSTDFIFN